MVGQLRDRCAVALGPVSVDRLHPRRFGKLKDRLANRLGQLVAHRKPDRSTATVSGERVRAPADIGAHQDLQVKVLGGQLGKREPEHGEMVLGRVRRLSKKRVWDGSVE